MKRLHKVLVSAFVVLNLGTVLFMNRPAPVIQAANLALDECPHPNLAYYFRYAGWMDECYAHLAGLNNRWQMFGRLPPFQWSYVIKAEYADGATVVLPLPGQSERTFWQRTLFDFKEAKFNLNVYTKNDPSARRARQGYANYLARCYPYHGAAPVKAIVWELHTQRILPPDKARECGTHLEPQKHRLVLDRFPCQ